MSKRINRWSLRFAALGMTFASFAGLNAQDLTIGSKAPKLDIEHWVSNGNGKFKPVKEFEAGKVYVVEFWATWCGPCVMSMPHLAETQNKYADKGVQLISVSDEDLETVEGFLKRQVKGSEKEDTDNTYGKLTSAYCLTTDPDNSVNDDYMKAAGQNGIPTCFIVGKSGQIEWIGHPMEMDEPLEKVVDGSWDRKAYQEAFRKDQQFGLLMSKLNRPMQKGDTQTALKILAKAKEDSVDDKAMIEKIEDVELRIVVFSAMKKVEAGSAEEALAEIEAISKTAKPAQKLQLAIAKSKALISIVTDSGKNAAEATQTVAEVAANKETDATSLNELAWTIYEAASEDKKFPKTLIAAATDAAQIAVTKEPTSSPILDTLAHLLHLQGKLDRAIELQTRAVENASDDMKEDLQEFLAQMKKEKAGK
jgi:thiol-disulfide isomerase/thioredoxin